jgi:DNA-binding transcriptional regulator YhcF (GntR family)
MTSKQIASTIYTSGLRDGATPGDQLALARQFAVALAANDATFRSEPFIRAATTGAWPQ